MKAMVEIIEASIEAQEAPEKIQLLQQERDDLKSKLALKLYDEQQEKEE